MDRIFFLLVILSSCSMATEQSESKAPVCGGPYCLGQNFDEIRDDFELRKDGWFKEYVKRTDKRILLQVRDDNRIGRIRISEATPFEKQVFQERIRRSDQMILVSSRHEGSCQSNWWRDSSASCNVFECNSRAFGESAKIECYDFSDNELLRWSGDFLE